MRILVDFQQKYYKTTEKLKAGVCGSFYGTILFSSALTLTFWPNTSVFFFSYRWKVTKHLKTIKQVFETRFAGQLFSLAYDPLPTYLWKKSFHANSEGFSSERATICQKLVLLISDGNKPKHLESLKVALVAHFLGLNCLHQHLISFPHVHRKWSFLANSEACDSHFWGPKTSILILSNENVLKHVRSTELVLVAHFVGKTVFIGIIPVSHMFTTYSFCTAVQSFPSTSPWGLASFKHRRWANAAISVNTTIASEYCYASGCCYASKHCYICQCSWLIVRPKCTYGNMAEIELFCVGVATLLRNKYASILRVISHSSTCYQSCQGFYSIVLDIYLA